MTFLRRKINTVSPARMITIGNPFRSKAPMVIGGVSVIGSNFVINTATTTCTSGATFAKGKSCHVAIRFAPGVTGRLSANVMVSDNTTNSPHLMLVYGTGM
jgi:hypothetical protein